MTFKVTEIPDLKGKVAIVTGANTGIGKPTALELARKGAHVFLACRSEEKTKPVVEEIKKETGNQKVEFLKLDLSSLKSVKESAQEFIAKKLPLHILVNNAGIMALQTFEKTSDGVEMQFGTNYLGHFHFTNLLLPIIEKSAPARIVIVSSSAHRFASRDSFKFEFINDPAKYSPWTQYGISKASNILHAVELNERLQKRGVKNVYVNALHPGVINTELTRNMSWFVQWLKPVMGWFLTNSEDGALNQLYVATHTDIETKPYQGQFFNPVAKHEPPTELCQDKEFAKQLWEFGEKLIAEKTKGK